jgi:DNA gyrase subunit A
VEKFASVHLLKTAKKKYSRYAKHVLGFRHFPEGRDGLKPVQRRALWALHQLGATDRAKKVATSRAVGECFAEGTPVATPTGLVPIELLDVGDVVRTSRGDAIVTRTFVNGPKPMCRITLDDGRFVVCTLNQEFKVRVGESFFWKRASELSSDDEIVVEFDRE